MKIFSKNIFSIIVAVIIVFFSFVNPDNINRVNILHFKNADKLFHAFMYFVFTLTIILEHRYDLNKMIHLLYSGIVPFFLGFTIEILQSVITKNRSGEIVDIIFNLSGVIMAMIVCHLFKLLVPKL